MLAFHDGFDHGLWWGIAPLAIGLVLAIIVAIVERNLDS